MKLNIHTQQVKVTLTPNGAEALNIWEGFGNAKAGDTYTGPLSDLMHFFGGSETPFVNDEVCLASDTFTADKVADIVEDEIQNVADQFRAPTDW